jgi:hypothetical protein
VKETRESFFSRTGGALIPAVLTGIALALIFFAFVDWLGAYRMEQAERGWEETLGSWEEMVQRFPAREANAAALAVERLSAELGINTAQRHRADGIRPTPGKVATYRSVKAEAGKYLQSQIERTTRGVDPATTGLASYLDNHREELRALHEQLLHDETPRWEQHLELLYAAPVPNLVGLLELQRLMLADSVARYAEGDREGALSGLEASWHLNLALRDDPALITQLIAMAVARMQAGVVRQFDDLPDIWHERLSENDFRDSFLFALQVEAQGMMQMPTALGREGNLLHLAIWNVARPYNRLCAASLSDEMRRRLVRLSKAEALCSGDPGYHGADLNVPVPRWNLLGRLIVPNLGSSLERLARLELDTELSLKVLEVDSARRSNGGQFPRTVEGIADSAACPEERWEYYVDPSGKMTILFSRELTWPNQPGTKLPTRFTVRN